MVSSWLISLSFTDASVRRDAACAAECLRPKDMTRRGINYAENATVSV